MFLYLQKNRIMKKILLSLTILTSTLSFSADLVVQDSGPSGTYGSIAAAVTAAVDGDRIVINNKLTAMPWQEDIVVNKSLTFVSAADNQRFLVQGDYTIQHAPGREVTIIGMDNVAGDISTTANGITSRTIVNLMWCKITDGQVNFDYNLFELNVASSLFTNSSYITLRYGSVIGNEMSTESSITVNEDANSGNDTIFVVGNRNLRRIALNTTAHYVFCSNNLLYQNINGVFEYAIDVFNTKTGTASNIIKNNTIYTVTDGIVIRSSNTGDLYIFNNVMDCNGSGYGIRNQGTGSLAASYNHISSDFSYELDNIANDGTNVTTSTFSVNLTTGTNTSTTAVNGGSPGITDYDLDLTINDAGCLGGSYTLSNFHPIDGQSSKVYFLKMPDQIVIGGTNPVTGHSFDR